MAPSTLRPLNRRPKRAWPRGVAWAALLALPDPRRGIPHSRSSGVAGLACPLANTRLWQPSKAWPNLWRLSGPEARHAASLVSPGAACVLREVLDFCFQQAGAGCSPCKHAHQRPLRALRGGCRAKRSLNRVRLTRRRAPLAWDVSLAGKDPLTSVSQGGRPGRGKVMHGPSWGMSRRMTRRREDDGPILYDDWVENALGLEAHPTRFKAACYLRPPLECGEFG